MRAQLLGKGKILIAGAAVLLLGIAGCSGAGAVSSGMMSVADQGQAEAPEQGTAAGEGQGSGSGPAKGPDGPPAAQEGTASGGKTPAKPDLLTAPADRQVVRTATMSVTVEVASTGKGDRADRDAVEDAVTAAGQKARAAAGVDGYVSSAEGRGSVVTITLRVPATGYQAAMDSLAGLGRVADRQEKVEDVTAQLVDLGSRVETMKASVARVRALLAKADKIGDVVAIESELSQRQADLESLERQQAALAGRAALSTISVTLSGRIAGVAPVAQPQERTGFLGGLADGWDAMTAIALAVATFLGAILPFLPVLAVLVIAVIWWRRRHRRMTPAAAPLAAPVAE